MSAGMTFTAEKGPKFIFRKTGGKFEKPRSVRQNAVPNHLMASVTKLAIQDGSIPVSVLALR